MVRSCKTMSGLLNPSFKSSVYNIFTNMFRFLFQFQTNDDKCDIEMFIAYDSGHYIYIETKNGELEVKYIFTRKIFFN
jgi:hypothetical protein